MFRFGVVFRLLFWNLKRSLREGFRYVAFILKLHAGSPRVVLYVVLWFVSPTVLQTSNPTMSALLPAACALLLGLLGASFSPASCCRFQIPPHDQVARVARFVAHQCDWASMATISTHKPVAGQPFSNAFSVSDGTEGSGSGVPYMYLTRMEISVQDLEVTCTLLLQSALLLECLNYDKTSCKLCFSSWLCHVSIRARICSVQNCIKKTVNLVKLPLYFTLLCLQCSIQFNYYQKKTVYFPIGWVSNVLNTTEKWI